MSKSKLDEKFIVSLQGKDFVTYEGLLQLAHQKGLTSIKTEIVQLPTNENNSQCIVKAIVQGKDNEHFEGYGDADKGNVSRMIAKHIIRMAETRAKARALRDFTNIGMTAVDELGGEEESVSNKSTQTDDRKVLKNKSYASDKQLNFMYKLVKDKKYGNDKIAKYIKTAYNKDSSKELTRSEASEMIKMLQDM